MMDNHGDECNAVEGFPFTMVSSLSSEVGFWVCEVDSHA